MEILEYLELAKKALLSPKEAFKKYKLEMGESLVYYTILLTINSILAALFFPKMLLIMIPPEYSVGLLVVVRIITSIVGILIGSAWLHLFVMLFGGKGYEKTLRANIISTTPMLLFGWIPYVGIVTWVWSFILLIIGLSVVHRFSTGRSFIVLLISGLIPLVILIILVMLAFSSVYTFASTIVSNLTI